MNIQEAKKALQDGHKITHKYFLDYEYLELKEGELLTCEGYITSWSRYIGAGAPFLNGWEIFTK